MSGQSSGQTPRTSTSSRPSPSSNTRFNRNGDTDIHNSEDLDDGIAAAKQAWDEHSRRRQRPRSSGGFLLQVPPGPDSYPVTYPEQEVSDNVKGKRKLLDGDIIVKKRSSARQQHRQKPSLGSSPLATEISNAQPSEQPPNTINSTNEYAPSHQTSHKSRNATEGLGLSKDGAHPDSGRSAVGFDTDPAQIVNLALSLSESRRRNFSTGSHLVPRDAIEARRLPSTGQPILGLSPGTAGGSLRHHLQQQRQVPRNVSPRSSKSFGGTGAGSPLSQKKMPSRRSSALPDFNMGHIDNASINASDATIARVEKARAALELAYEYRRLLQYLPKLPAPTRSSRGSIKSQTISAEDLGRSYNPLQYIRNRKVRFNEKRPLDAEGQGWNVIENVRPWVDTVVAQGEDGLSRADRKSPLPSVDTFEQTLTVTDGTQATSSQARKVTRPHTVWEFAASDLLADAYWLHQDDNGMHIEDANGNKLVTDHRLPNDDRPRTSKESTRSHLRRSESFMRLNGSPERFRASLENLRSGSKDRGRRRQDTKEPRSPVSDDNGSQTRKSRWPRKFVRSRSPSSSGESRGPKRRGHQRGNDHLGSRDEYDNAALEKHMMEILAREAEDSEAVVEKISAQSKRPENLDHGPNDRSGLNGQIFESENRRPSALQRMRTDMPLSRKHEIVARASLDEQRFAHHRMSSDDFDSTAPNSPTASGFVPSIAINLSPPSSPPTATSSPRKPVPSRLSTFRRTHSPSVHKRVLSENDIEPDAGTLADISRQTTNESQPVNLIRKDRSLPTSNGFLSPTKTDPLRGSIRSTKEGNVPDSRFRSLFKGGRIAELVGSGVSRVGDLFWKKDSSSHPSETNSPAPSNFASEESNPDDGDDGLLNSSPDNDHSQKKTNTEDMSSLSRASPKSEQPKYHMSNLPSFQSSINRDRGLPNAAKATSGYDHITRQQLALRERGRSSRFDRLAPPKIDMRNISPSPSPSPSPDHAVGRVTSKGESRHSSSSRSSRRVRSADKRLNDALKIPGKVATGYLAPTGLSRLAVHQQESRARPTPGDKRQWSISDRGLSAVRGTITKRDIARVRALLLSSGVKASEIVRRAEEIPANPSPLLQGLEDVFNGNLPHLPRSQEYIVAGRTLVSNIETTTQNLRDTADEFSHVTVDKLHHQIKDIDDRVNFELTPLVRAAADDADAFSTELTTTHTLAVKQLNDSVDLILRRRRRRLRWVRRWGWAMLEWTLLGVMWMVWFVVMVIQLVRSTIAAFVGGVRWLLWL